MHLKNKPLMKYSPKSLQGALALFFKKNFPVLASDIVLPPIVDAVMNLIDRYFPKTENMKPGEAFCIGVHKDAKPGCRKTLYDTEMAPCVVEIHNDYDVEMKMKGIAAKKIKQSKTERIIKQAFEQQVVFSNIDIGHLLNLSPATVGKYIREIEIEKNILLPTRAVIHDLGPKITHKVWIINKHFLQKKSIQEIMHETHHSETAINRYLNDFKRVNLLVKKSQHLNLDNQEIAKSTGLSLRLVQEYIKIINRLDGGIDK
jgi:hypothetical protein